MARSIGIRKNLVCAQYEPGRQCLLGATFETGNFDLEVDELRRIDAKLVDSPTQEVEEISALRRREPFGEKGECEEVVNTVNPWVANGVG